MSSSEDEDDHHSVRSDGSPINAHTKLNPTNAFSLPVTYVQTNAPSLVSATLPPLDAINLKFSQLHDGILSLARAIEAEGDRSIASWPETLAKYNFLVSQSHILSQSLSNHVPSADEHSHSADPRTRKPPLSTLPRLVIQPSTVTPDDQSMDFRVASLMRTALIPVMSEQEDRLLNSTKLFAENQNEEVTLHELDRLVKAHDGRVSRTLEQAMAFREQYDWNTRISVAPPDDAPHSPSINVPAASPVTFSGGLSAPTHGQEVEDIGSDILEEAQGSPTDTEGTNTSDEAFLLEAELEDGGDGAVATPSGAPSVTSETSRT